MAKTTDDLLQELITQMKKGGSSGGGSSINSKDPLQQLRDAIRPTTGSFEGMKKEVTGNIDIWRKLSGVGANFSNDVIGMSISAKEARLELGEFADLVSNNAKNFAGLGGSVTRGVEAFSKLSREFQENDLNRDLLNLGLTSKDVNEMLALQVGFQKRINMANEEERKKAFDATEGLAKEMDFLAKVTGKSRDEQEKALREQQRKGEVESKMRLIGLEKGADAEKEARRRYAEQYAQASARGQGALFEDMFTKGVPASEEAATQLALMGKAGQATAESAKALADANWLAADAANKRATQETVALQSDKTFLTLGAMGPKLAGVAGDVAKTSVEVNDALFQAVKSTQELSKEQLNYAQALAQIRKEVIKSQGGENLKGIKVSGATEGYIALEKAMKDAQAGIAGSMDIANASGKSIADSLRNVGSTVATAASELGNIRQRIVSDVEQNLKTKGKEGSVLGGLAVAAQTIAQTAEVTATTATIVVKDLINKDFNPKKPERSTGSPGVGKIVEDWGKETEVKLHGNEAVLTEAQLLNLAKGTQQTGVTQALDSLKNAIPKEIPAPLPKIDIAGIPKTITTTVSAAPAETKKEEKLPPAIAAIEQGLATTANNIVTGFKKLVNLDGPKQQPQPQVIKVEEPKQEQPQPQVIKIEEPKKETEKAPEKPQVVAPAEPKKETPKPQVVAPAEPKKETPKPQVVAPAAANPMQKDPATKAAAVVEPKKEPIKPAEKLTNAGVVKDGKINLNMFDAPGISNFGTALKPATPKEEPSTQAKTATQQAGKVNSDKDKTSTENESAAETARLKKQQTKEQPAPLAEKATASQKSATLDDVVGSLNKLNTQMSQLISQQSDLMRRQIGATKANSSNVYEQVGY